MSKTNVLDDLLGQRSKVAVLRALFQEKELVGREIARKTGLSPRAAHKALKELLEQGIVNRKVLGGSYIFSLNEKRYAVKELLAPLFESEGKLFSSLVDELRRLIPGNQAVSLALFGSFARGESGRKSDLDLLVLLKTPSKIPEVKELIERRRQGFIGRFGVFPSSYVIGVRDFAKRFDRKDKLIRAMVREGWVVWGKSLAEVLADEPKETGD